MKYIYLRHFKFSYQLAFDHADNVALSRCIFDWSDVYRRSLGTHWPVLQSQGQGSQEKPGPQSMAAHAPKSGQGGRKSSFWHGHLGPVE